VCSLVGAPLNGGQAATLILTGVAAAGACTLGAVQLARRNAALSALYASAILNVVLLLLLASTRRELTSTRHLLDDFKASEFRSYPGVPWNVDHAIERKVQHPPSPPMPPFPPPARVQDVPAHKRCRSPGQCLDAPQDVAGCERHLECALSPAARHLVYAAYHSAHTHTVPPELGPQLELLVPIKKQIMPPAAAEQYRLDYTPAPWPARINLDNLDWAAIPNGEKFRRCGQRAKRGEQHGDHMYCKYYTREYLDWAGQMPGSEPFGDPPNHIFDRPDVRLVLDLGASTGVLARHLYAKYGDRIVTVSATLITAGEVGGAPPPFLQTIAARGFPTVALDLFSYFPFGESTFDVIHSSWAYTAGYSHLALLEMYRVVRPGGFLVLTVWDKAAGTRGSLRVEKVAHTLGWRVIDKREMLSGPGMWRPGGNATWPYVNVRLALQVPAYKYV